MTHEAGDTMTKEVDDMSAGSHGYPQQVACEACAGQGRIVVGERFVSREMAIDAECASLEGRHYEFVYGQCGQCGGDGWVSDNVADIVMTEKLYKLLEERHRDLMVFFGNICCDPQRWPIHLKPMWDKYLLELGCKKGLQSGDFFNIPSPSNEWKETVAFPKEIAMKALALGGLPKMDLK